MWPGLAGELPAVGDWNHDGFVDDLGVFRPSNGRVLWLLDRNGNKTWDTPAGGDRSYRWSFLQGDRPAIGDWNGDGFVDDPGLFRVFSGQAYWRLDNNGDKLWSGIAGGDGLYLWPATPQDLPVPGQWTKP